MQSFITPNSEFFIRSHQASPHRADPNKFKLRIFDQLAAHKKPSSEDDDEDETPLKKFTLKDLRERFTPQKVMNAMSCAGNRRLGMKEFNSEVQGNSWYIGAIGNTVYTGVLIIDLLKDLGLNLDELKDKHLIAESMDLDV